MRVSVWIEEEVEIDVDPAQVLAQLPDATPGAASDIMRMLSRCHSCIAAITEDQIAAMTPKQRAVIRDGFGIQIARFEEKTSSGRTVVSCTAPDSA